MPHFWSLHLPSHGFCVICIYQASKHQCCTSSGPYLKTLFFKIRIIVGAADGLPQNFGHSSRATWYRSVPPLVGSSRQEVLVMRALFDRVAISLKTVQMLIGSRQDAFRHATDTCSCSRGLGPSVWAELACSNRWFSRLHPRPPQKVNNFLKVARCGRISSGNNDENTSANACHGS